MRRTLIAVLVCGLICLLGTTMALAYNEAPMLKTKVAAGILPPVEERLPQKPVIVEPLEEIGQYGGRAQTLGLTTQELEDAVNMMGWEPLLRIAPDCKTVAPNIAKDWKLSEDGKKLTLYLHKGIKWSDGKPFTADDIMFWYKDVLLNEDLTPVPPKDWSPGGKLAVVKKLDDYTIEMDFAAPYPVMPMMLAHCWGPGPVTYPPQYLKQFHIKYNPKAEEIAKKAGYDFWYQYFWEKRHEAWSLMASPGEPTLSAFECLERTTDHYLFRRNPYYWKVDTAGNQLPYIDEVYVTLVADKEMANAKASTGQADFAGIELIMANYTLYMKNREKGHFRVVTWPSAMGGMSIFQPNQTDKDPIFRKIFRDVRFRRALSLAINRDEINEVVFHGLGVPRQMTVLSDCSYFKPEFAEAYADYKPDEANRLLDEMDLKWDKNHEYRLRPDGKRLGWTIEYYPCETAKTPVAELVREYWKEIGVKVELKVESGSFTSQRATSNEMDMNIWHGDKVNDILFTVQPQFFVPYSHGWETTWAPDWALWYITGGKEGEEPPEKAMNLIKWWEKMKTTMDEEERIQLGQKILASQAENLWTIGTVGEVKRPIIIRDNLRNFPEESLWGWDVLWTYPTHPEQYFFKQK